MNAKGAGGAAEHLVFIAVSNIATSTNRADGEHRVSVSQPDMVSKW